MKIRRPIFLITTLISPAFVIPFIASCSKSDTTVQNDIENAKTELDNLLATHKAAINENCVKPLNESISTSINMLNILEDPQLVGSYFSFDSNALGNDDVWKDFTFEFTYGIVDSYGNSLSPFVSSNKTSITVPILVYYKSAKHNNAIVKKYVNLFTLPIIDTKITEKNDYIGVEAKQVIFKNNQKTVNYEPVPAEMVKKYIDFIVLTTTSEGWKKLPIYQSKSEQLKDWRNKTLSEVKQISQAIKPPDNYYDGQQKYKYSISNSYFYGKKRDEAVFVIRMSLDSQYNSKLIKDAKDIYGLNYSKEYTIISSEYSFADPSENDITDYKSNNTSLLQPILASIKSNVLLYVPTVLVHFETVKSVGVKGLIERYKRGTKDFEAPESFIYIAPDGQTRKVSFSINTIKAGSEGESSNVTLLEIELNVTIDEGDLAVSDKYSKKFDVKECKFV